jgi:hypothetical protein
MRIILELEMILCQLKYYALFTTISLGPVNILITKRNKIKVEENTSDNYLYSFFFFVFQNY